MQEDPRDYDQELENAAEAGDVPAVLGLLQKTNANPKAHESAALVAAAKNNHVQIVQILLEDGRAEPNDQNGEALLQAAEHGHLHVVRLLLKNRRANPAARDNAPVCIAAENDRHEVLEELLADDRVDPTADEDYAIEQAASNGCTRTLRILLKDGRANPDSAIGMAAQAGHIEAVRELLADSRVRPAEDRGYAIKKSAEYGHAEITCLLLASHPTQSARTKLVKRLLRLGPAPGVKRLLQNYEYSLVSGIVDCLHVLLKMPLTRLSTPGLFWLADILVRRNVNLEQLACMLEQGLLVPSLQKQFGPDFLLSSIRAIAAARYALISLAAVSKAFPILRSGGVKIEAPELILEIVHALVPALPPPVARNLWETMRSQTLSRRAGENVEGPSSRLRSTMLTNAVDEALQGHVQEPQQKPGKALQRESLAL